MEQNNNDMYKNGEDKPVETPETAAEGASGAQPGEKPRKKRRSLWWLWFLLILAAFAGGIVCGLKINTLPLPTEVRDRIYPVLESYIPGSTTPRTPDTASACARACSARARTRWPRTSCWNSSCFTRSPSATSTRWHTG